MMDGSGKPLDEAKFVSDFAAALNEMLENPDIVGFGQRGRARVEKHFSWDQIAKDTIKVYADAIASFA
jgi:starch synthase